MEFNKFEAKLYLDLARALGSEQPFKAYEYENGTRAGHFQVGTEEDPIELVFSIPKENDDCYIFISDGNPKKLCQEVAMIQEYNENQAHLCLGHTVPTKNEYFNNAGWVSYLISRPAIVSDDIPDIIEIQDRKIRVRLVVLLSENDYDIKLNHGLDALYEHLDNINRDVVGFINA